MVGYDFSAGMSNNAVAAYGSGLVPASKIKGVPAVLVKQFCRAVEWHHASSRFNEVKFYDPQQARAAFGLVQLEDFDVVPEAVAALAQYKADKRTSATVVHEGMTVEWLEWGGSIKHPVCEECRAADARVEVKAQTATITLLDGTSFKKRLTTRGFRFFKPTPPAAPPSVSFAQPILPGRAILATAGYRGLGRAWAAVDAAGDVIALRYMSSQQQGTPVDDFPAYRAAMRQELEALGTVISGGVAGPERFVDRDA